MKKTIFTVQELITPEKAWEYLCQGKREKPATFKEVLAYVKAYCFNRTINMNAVYTYADAMKNGDWMENGENIVIDDTGVVIGGHHRLLAIILANVPVRTGVCRNVAREAYLTLNQGLAETLGGSFSRSKPKNYNTIASIVGVNDTLIRTGRCWANNSSVGGGRKRTNLRGHRLYDLDPLGYDQVAEDTLKLFRNSHVISPSWLGGLIYYLSHTGGYDYDYVMRFFKDVCSFETTTIQPANALRVRLLRESSKVTKLNPPILFVFIVKAWNAYVLKKTVGILKFDPEKESFPALILKR